MDVFIKVHLFEGIAKHSILKMTLQADQPKMLSSQSKRI
jgi:hypothetical protein